MAVQELAYRLTQRNNRIVTRLPTPEREVNLRELL